MFNFLRTHWHKRKQKSFQNKSAHCRPDIIAMQGVSMNTSYLHILTCKTHKYIVLIKQCNKAVMPNWRTYASKTKRHETWCTQTLLYTHARAQARTHTHTSSHTNNFKIKRKLLYYAFVPWRDFFKLIMVLLNLYRA